MKTCNLYMVTKYCYLIILTLKTAGTLIDNTSKVKYRNLLYSVANSLLQTGFVSIVHCYWISVMIIHHAQVYFYNNFFISLLIIRTQQNFEFTYTTIHVAYLTFQDV